PSTVLCAESCDTLGSSINAYLSSPLCPAVPAGSVAGIARTAALSASTNCASTVAAWEKDVGPNSKCVAAVSADFASTVGKSNKAGIAADASTSGTTSSAPNGEDQGGLSTAAKIGIAIGVVLLLALIAAFWIVYSNRHNIFPPNHPVMKYLGDGGRPSFVKRSPLAQFRGAAVGPTGASATTTTTTTKVEKTYVRIADEETGGAGAATGDASKLGERTVVEDYTAQMPDELSLRTGETILVLQAHDDGWGLGRLTRTGAEGAFPLVCVAHHKKRVAIVTFASGKAAETVGKITLPNKQAYASRHNYTFFNYASIMEQKWPNQKKSIYYTKFLSVLDLFDQGYEWVLWSDADALFLNHGQGLEEFMDEEYDLVVPTAEPANKQFSKVVNLGHFMFKNSGWSRKYIEYFLQVASLDKCVAVEGRNVMNGWLETCDAHGRFWLDDQGAMMWTFQRWERDVECHVKRVSFHHFDSEWPWFMEGDLVRVQMFTDILAITDLKTGLLNHSDPRYETMGPDNKNPGADAAETRKRFDKEYVDVGWNRVCQDGEGDSSVLVV
ncbi:UNVERIFIED_CONTAM: hypothetical protein HDU68_005779, partial [Siphonaria sp. JEL0065]